MNAFVRTNRYAERVIRPAGVIRHDGWRLKRYDISLRSGRFDEVVFARGMAVALAQLPLPAATRDRPGVGVLICHGGAGADYVVLCWWDNQNELLQRVVTRQHGGGADWQDSTGRASFCVWDMQVLWHERNAFVRHVLEPASGTDLQAYLTDVLVDAGHLKPG